MVFLHSLSSVSELGPLLSWLRMAACTPRLRKTKIAASHFGQAATEGAGLRTFEIAPRKRINAAIQRVFRSVGVLALQMQWKATRVANWLLLRRDPKSGCIA